MAIRILIVDDHAVVRAGISMLLSAEPDLEIVGEAGDGREAVFQARVLKPDMILIDVVMPGQTGIETIPQLVHEQPDVKVVVLSMEDKPSLVHEAFAAGASGYVLKEAVGPELVAAIRDVVEGRRYLHPALGARLVLTGQDAQQRAVDDPLSPREHDVLRLVTLGHTNKEIAEQLFISVRTAEGHRARIMDKLGLENRAELVKYGMAHLAAQR